MIKCSKCGCEYDSLDANFYKRKNSANGYSRICIKCTKVSKSRNIMHKRGDLLLCLICNTYKDTSEFDISNKNLHRCCRDRRCKSCKSLQRIKRRESSRGKRDLDRLLLERWHGMKDRAYKKGLVVDFDWRFLKELWISQNGICAVSGIAMTYVMQNGRIPTNLSIDRIDSSIGYIKENIQLVCMAVNQMKSDLSLSELYNFCSNILKYNNYEN